MKRRVGVFQYLQILSGSLDDFKLMDIDNAAKQPYTNIRQQAKCSKKQKTFNIGRHGKNKQTT